MCCVMVLVSQWFLVVLGSVCSVQGFVYVAIHGVLHRSFDVLDVFFVAMQCVVFLVIGTRVDIESVGWANVFASIVKRRFRIYDHVAWLQPCWAWVQMVYRL